MGGSEETRSIVYLDYWGSAAGQRWRSSRSAINPSLPCSRLLRMSRKGLTCFAMLLSNRSFPAKVEAASDRSVDI